MITASRVRPDVRIELRDFNNPEMYVHIEHIRLNQRDDFEHNWGKP